MNCKLCQKEVCIKKAHVIPEFLIKFTYDHKHNFNVITIRDGAFDSYLREKKYQTGLDIDKHLTGGKCEALFSRWETYVSKAFYKWKKFKPKLQTTTDQASGRSERYVVIPRVDYRNFKLFFLSILWRISASEIQICEDVSIGEDEHVIREMLLEGDPGPFTMYPTILSGVNLGDYPLLDVVDIDSHKRGDRAAIVRLLAGGFMFTFFTIPELYPPSFRDFFLKEDGDLPVLFKDVQNCDIIQK